MERPPRTLYGIAGWSYRDWHGPFYPRPAPPDFAELEYAAAYFDCLEVNSSFYRIPEPRTVESWASRTAERADLRFTAKLFRGLTHSPIAPDDIAPLCREFLDAFSPLRSRGRLDAVVAQFPWHFEDTLAHRDLLRRIADGLDDVPLQVEVRHRSFLRRDGPAGERAALELFGDLGIGFVNVDMPRSNTSPGPTSINTSTIGYFRLHGRNHTAWFDRDAGRDATYDYLYDDAELDEISELIERVAARARSTYVIANNHFRGQAAVNSLQLMRRSGRDPTVPPPLLDAYPALAAIAKKPEDPT